MKSPIRKYFLRLLFFFLIGNFLVPKTQAQNQANNSGKEFWMTFNLNLVSPTLILYMTSKENTVAYIRSTTVNDSVRITKDSTTIYTFSNTSAHAGAPSTSVQTKGIRITAAKDISVFAINNGSASTDASMILPKHILGRSPVYIVNNYQIASNPRNNHLTIVATEDSTKLEIITSNVFTVGNIAKGATVNVTLNRFQTYSMGSRNDISGTIVRNKTGCKPFVVFIGNECSNIPNGCNACDHTFTQDFPTLHWGTQYFIPPFANHTNGYEYKITAAEDSTKVTINGSTTFYLMKGTSSQRSASTAVVTCVQADKIISVSQAMKGQSCNGTNLGDPAIMMLNPVEQMIPRALFNTVSTTRINTHFVTITLDTAFKNLLKIDGNQAKKNKFKTANCGRYIYYQDSITWGSHLIECDSGFIAYVHGYGQYESYAYSGGASFENRFYNFNIVAPKRCPGDTIRVQAFGNNIESVKFLFGNKTDSGMTAWNVYKSPGKYKIRMAILTTDGCTFYDTIEKIVEIGGPKKVFFNDTTFCSGFKKQVFRVNKNELDTFYWSVATNKTDSLVITKGGKYTVTLKDTFGCSWTDSVTIKQLFIPKSKYLYDSLLCETIPLNITNTTNDSGQTSKMSYYLKINDTTFTFNNNIKVIPKDTGKINVRFISSNSNTCNDTSTFSVRVIPKPLANFKLNDSIQCLTGNQIQPTNLSKGFNYPLTHFWIFGDNTTSTTKDPTKSYSVANLYSIKLIEKNAYNCSDTTTEKYVIIKDSPIAKFVGLDSSACEKQNKLSFKNTSSGAAASYKWTINDTLTFPDSVTGISYAFNKSGNYTIKLVANTVELCKDSFSKSIQIFPLPTVNLSKSNDSLCDKNHSFTFISSTTILTGSLTHQWKIPELGNIFNDTASGVQFPTIGLKKITYIAKSDKNCADSVGFEVRVWPSPKASILAVDTSGCEKKNIIRLLNSTPTIEGGLAFRWSIDTLVFKDSTSSLSHLFDNYGSYTAKLVATSIKQCVDSVSKHISINPQPTLNYKTNHDSACFNSQNFNFISLSALSSGVLTHYWQIPGYPLLENDTAIGISFTNTGTKSIKLKVISEKQCSDSISFNVTIWPNPNASFVISDTTGCEKQTSIKLTNTTPNLPGGLDYKWSINTISFPDSSQTLTYIYPEKGIYTNQLIVKSRNNCADTVFQASEIFATPNILAIADTTAQCFKTQNFNFISKSSISTGNIQHLWKIPDYGIAIGDTVKNISFNNDGIKQVLFTAQSDKNCADSVLIPITVHPSPGIVNFTFNPLFCEPLELKVSNQSIDVDSVKYFLLYKGSKFLFSDSILKITTSDTGNLQAFFVAAHSNRCFDTSSFSFKVIPKPVIQFEIPYKQQCFKGNSFETKNLSNSFGYPATFVWDFGDGTSGYDTTEPIHSYSDTGVFNISVIITNQYNCKDTAYEVLSTNFYPIPKAAFSTNKDSMCFKNNEFTFTDLSILSSGTYKMFVGIENVDTSEVFGSYQKSIPFAGTYNVDYFIISDKRCFDTASSIITVWESPLPSFTYTDTVGCENQTKLHFKNTTPLINGSLSYKWITNGIEENDSAFNFSYIYPTFGKYEMKLTATSNKNCTDTFSRAITIHPVPNIGIFANIDSQCYKSQKFNLFSTSTIASGTLRNFWNIPEHGVIENDSVVGVCFTSKGEKEIRYRATSDQNCSDSSSISLMVWPNPVASFTIDTLLGCEKNNAFRASSQSVIDGNSIQYLNWYTDNYEYKLDSLFFVTNFDISGIHTIIHEVVSDKNCKDTIDTNIFIQKNPIAKFNASWTDSCLLTHEINVQDKSQYFTGFATKFYYTSDNRNFDSIESFTLTFSAAGNYNIRQIIIDSIGCVDTTYVQKTVRSNPLATIFSDKNNSCLPYNQFQLGYTAHVRDNLFFTKWTIPDENITSSDSTIKISFSDSGNKKIYLQLENKYQCRGYDTFDIRVFEKNNLTSSTQTPIQCFNEHIFNLEYTSRIDTSMLAGYEWNLGDGTFYESIGGMKKKYADTGKYKVLLVTTTQDNCKDTAFFDIEVLASPEALFSLNKDEWCSNNQEIKTISNAIITKGNISNHFWDFGDGYTSNKDSVVNKKYNNAGSYTLTYIATADNGCKDTNNRLVTINPSPIAAYNIPIDQQCLKSNVFNLENLSIAASGMSSVEWEVLPLGWTSNENLYRFTVPDAGNYSFRMIINDLKNCKDTINGFFKAFPQTKIGFEIDTVCHLENTQFVSTSTLSEGEITKWEWDAGDNKRETGEAAIHVYKTPGYYNVTLYTETDFGCKDTLTKQNAAYVRTLPTAGFTALKTKGWEKLTGIQFNNTSSPNPLTYNWTFDNLGASNEVNPYFEFADTGTNTITLWATDRFGCKDSAQLTFFVFPESQVFVPNAFSPDGNNLNETFRPMGLAYANKYEMEIYNRWGQRLFRTENLQEAWDGTFNGTPVPEGVYIYKITIITLNKELVTSSGSITILR